MPTVDIPGDPSGLDALAGQLESAANDINAVRDRVATNGLDGEWSGQAADAFRSTLHRLPGELATVGGAFGDAMGTIRSFAGRLTELQQQARWYEEKLEESERDLREANSRHDEAAEGLRSANRAQASAADPVSLHAAKQAVERGESIVRQAITDVEDLGGQVSQLNSGAGSIRREYEEAIRSCCSALDAACPPGESVWSGLRHGFDDMTGGAILLGGAAWRGADRGLRDAENDLDNSFAVKAFDYYWAGARRIIIDTTEELSDVTLGIAAAAAVAGVAITAATGGPGAVLGVPLEVIAGVSLTANELIGKVGDGAAVEGDAFAEATSQTKAEKGEYRNDLPEDAVSWGVSWIPGGKASEPVIKKVGGAVIDDAIGIGVERGLHDVEELQSHRSVISPPLTTPSVFRIVPLSATPAFV